MGCCCVLALGESIRGDYGEPLVDLGFNGLPYTWDNKQTGDRNVKVRLDRGLADENFLDCFCFHKCKSCTNM